MFRDISELTRAIPGLEIECETKFPITTPAVVRYTVRLHGVRVLEDASEERFREFVTFLLLHKPTQSKINWDSIIDGTSIQTALINALKKIAKQQPFLAYAEETTYGTQPEKPAWQPYPGPTPDDLLQRIRNRIQYHRKQEISTTQVKMVLDDLDKTLAGVKSDPVRDKMHQIEACADETLRTSTAYASATPGSAELRALARIKELCQKARGL